jgi:predicted HAD superfamily phosphohydrolase YqeG
MAVKIITEVYSLDDIKHLDLPGLCEADFQITTFDLDKTIIGQEETELPKDRQDFFRGLGQTALQVAIVSNAFGKRVDRVRRIADQVSEITGRECLSVVPDDVEGIKKPHPEMLIHALTLAGIKSPYYAMHIGDQVRSDVKAAEGAGFRAAVLVKPMGEGDDPFVKFLGRPFVEPTLRRQRSLPGNVDDFPVALPAAYRLSR